MVTKTFFEWFTQYIMWIPITCLLLTPFVKYHIGKVRVSDAFIIALISIIPFCNIILSMLLLFALGEILGKRFIRRYGHILDKELL